MQPIPQGGDVARPSPKQVSLQVPVMPVIPQPSWICQRLGQQVIPQRWAGQTSRAINNYSKTDWNRWVLSLALKQLKDGTEVRSWGSLL